MFCNINMSVSHESKGSPNAGKVTEVNKLFFKNIIKLNLTESSNIRRVRIKRNAGDELFPAHKPTRNH